MGPLLTFFICLGAGALGGIIAISFTRGIFEYLIPAVFS